MTFAAKAADKGLVLCVGGDLVDAVQDLLPRDAALTTELLAELGLVRRAPTPHRVPLLPMPYAALLNRVIEGGDDPDNWKMAMARKLRQRGGEVATYQALGSLLLRLQSSDKKQIFSAVVTTNVDLTLENAFIETDLAFTSVIVIPEQTAAWQVRFPRKDTMADGRIALGDLQEQELSQGGKRLLDVRGFFDQDKGIAKLRGEDDKGSARIDEAVYVRRWRRNALISEQYEKLSRFHPANLTSLPGPLLVKILGSCHEGGDFCLSADELPRWRASKLLPKIKGLVGKSATVIVGYSLADLPFLFLQENVLPSELKVQGGQGPLSWGRPLAIVERFDQRQRPCDFKARIIKKLLEQGLEQRAGEIGAELWEVDDLIKELGRLGGEIASRLEG